MDVRFINPFVASVKNVFKTMIATDVQLGKPVVIKANAEQAADVSAVIGLSGDAVGCVVLSLPMKTATSVSSKFAGVEMDEHHPDFTDALGELANMVAGDAKVRFEGLNCNISLPSVIIGQHHIVSQSKQRPRLSLPCESTLGNFTVEVALVVVEKQKPAKPVPVAAGANA